ncbi:MAG: hypothetical protein NTX53_05700 [candidate division WOR-3 bacterium]|nr:hypothetical protein [candidate division WOR-3 bacterium]
MLQRMSVLLAVAGLLVLAYAGPSADLATPTRKQAGQGQDLDRVPLVPTRTTGTALPPGIDVNKVIQQVRSARESEPPPPELDANPFTEDEFMPAPTTYPVLRAGTQAYASVAFDGTNYLVVWQDYRNGNYDIYGTRVSTAGVDQDSIGIAITTSTGALNDPAVAFDGTNYLVVWMDYGSGSYYDIYGARVSTAGVVQDPSGIAISAAMNVQQCPAVAFDGTNYLVVWQDNRSGSSYSDIYGARVSQSGSVLDPAGILISSNTPTSSQESPAVAFDGTNYLVVWHDNRNGNNDIYGARVSTAGVVQDPSGIAISTATSDQQYPAVAFGGGYYLVVWQDNRSGSYSDIYGARVSQSGSVLDPAGILISSNTPTSSQSYPAVAFDGANYLVVWHDNRNGNYDIYGARVSTAGVVQDPSGIAISTATNIQQYPAVAFDGTNYLVVWWDERNDGGDIYGARVSTAGTTLDPDGILVGVGVNAQTYSAVAFDGTNYLVVWQDDRNYPSDICAARVSATGTPLDPAGIVISTNTPTSSQESPAVAFDGTNYLVVWHDNRNGNYDIYGARVSTAGVVQDASGIRISTATSDEQYPAVAFGGGYYLVVWVDKLPRGLGGQVQTWPLRHLRRAGEHCGCGSGPERHRDFDQYISPGVPCGRFRRRLLPRGLA